MKDTTLLYTLPHIVNRGQATKTASNRTNICFRHIH